MRWSKRDGSAEGLLRVLLVASVALPTLLFLGASWLNYRSALADAERELVRTSEVAREHASKVLDSQTLVADWVADLVQGMDEAAIKVNEKRLHEELARYVAHLTQVQSVLVVGKDGHPLVSATVYPVPGGIDVNDRDFFTASRAGAGTPTSAGSKSAA